MRTSWTKDHINVIMTDEVDERCNSNFRLAQIVPPNNTTTETKHVLIIIIHYVKRDATEDDGWRRVATGGDGRRRVVIDSDKWHGVRLGQNPIKTIWMCMSKMYFMYDTLRDQKVYKISIIP